MALYTGKNLENRAVFGNERSVLHEEEHTRHRGFQHLTDRAVAGVDDKGELLSAADMCARKLDPAQKTRAGGGNRGHVCIGDDGGRMAGRGC